MSQIPPIGKDNVLKARNGLLVVEKMIRQVRCYLENRFPSQPMFYFFQMY